MQMFQPQGFVGKIQENMTFKTKNPKFLNSYTKFLNMEAESEYKASFKLKDNTKNLLRSKIKTQQVQQFSIGS